jgi:isopentenyldiphosphate isomerase
MEYLDLVDEQGQPTGRIVSRAEAHAKKLPHRTSHVWILRQKEGALQILLQKRSDDKDAFPGCYDISCAGHIPAGEDYVPSALRELKEELGVDAAATDLIYCGQRHIQFDQVFHGKPFHDNQYTNVYILWLDREIEEFTLQREEVSEVCWLDFDDCLEKVRHDVIPHCIYTEELGMVARKAAYFSGRAILRDKR